MPYQTSRYRRRRRRRNSHYGVLIALILLIIIAIPVGYRLVKGAAGAIFGGDKDQVVFQVYNTKAYADGKLIDLEGAAPFVDQTGTTVVPLRAMSESLGLTVDYEQVSKTVSITRKKDTLRVQVGSKTLRFNDETKTLATAPTIVNGTTFVPVRDICEALSWQVGAVEAGKGHLVIVSKSKKALDDDKIAKISEKALEVLGPSRQQVLDGSVLMRTESDKLLQAGELKTMSDSTGKQGCAVMEQEGTRYIPLEGAVTALGGTAQYDGKDEWSVSIGGVDSTVRTNGKAKVGGKTLKGDDITVWKVEDTGRFYVSTALFAGMLGKQYTDMGDGSGTFAFTSMSLDGFDSQKAYLDEMQSELTQSVTSNIPEADVYVALTFDDGPTGATDTYPNGYTATLLDELKKRNVHATFFMCGYRIKDFNSHMNRYLEEGHELGNHTMDHPDGNLTRLDAETVRYQVESNNDLIESYTGQKPTVMRPVGGGVNDTVKEQMKALGLPIINWDLDTEDWKTKNDADSVKNHILNQVSDGAIVLMHDIWPGTLPGVLAAIDELQSKTDKTYAFVTVSELAAVKGITLEPGQVYNNLSDETVKQIQDGTYAPVTFL
ncbi:polysaccharide deacetylase family protein [Agathobaculum sp.]|uniref:polysaccharide deacetylase family protein n=1 Tax=Agathobaculum sp. TaxID=2048138 RepID=UPI002A81F150|nr:polysaccharide deacetylase family protein [Agathobaculum sp.]MDY3618475.1 polysaccharide deacetylase family protein [Agathobaculum sp.]